MQKIIIGLAGLNLVLVAYLVVALTRSPAGGKDDAPPALAAAPLTVAQTPAAEAPAEIPPPPKEFTWATLASPDLRKYADNLRQAGCPDETIKEIILAEVNRSYGPRESSLKVRPDDVAPWEKAALYDRRSAETTLRQLLEEKRALLKELTGVDAGIDMPSRLAGRNVEKFEGAFGAIPDDKRDQVRAIQESYWAQSDDIKQRIVGYLEPEDRAEFERIKTERREALAKVLTPAELQDYEIATSDVTPALRSRFQGFETTDEEFRKIFDFMQPLDDKYSLSRRNPDPVNEEFTAARSQAEKDLEQQIRSVLGDDRYAEYERSRDPAYRSLKQVASGAGVPQETIVQAYDVQRQIQSDSRRIMQDPSLTTDQRAQQLEGLRVQAEETIHQLFGDKAEQFMRQLPGAQVSQRFAIPVDRMAVNPTPTTEHVIQPVP